MAPSLGAGTTWGQHHQHQQLQSQDNDHARPDAAPARERPRASALCLIEAMANFRAVNASQHVGSALAADAGIDALIGMSHQHHLVIEGQQHHHHHRQRQP